MQGESLEGACSISAADPDAAKLAKERANGLLPFLDTLAELVVPCSFHDEQ